MPETQASWRTRKVFVTSTFRDMHAERDYLRDHVFPELAERLRERSHYLEPIDLRLGVQTASADEDRARELLVIKVCLGEIERCRPFLIALIGDRYGWVPPPERARAAAQESGFRTEVEGKSITALEIEFGILGNPGQRARSFLYFRRPLPYDEMDPGTAARYSEAHGREPGAQQVAQRLNALKNRIVDAMPERVRWYKAEWDAERKVVTGLQDFGRQVLEDLWRELEDVTHEFARVAAPSWEQQERWALEEFVDQHVQGFVGREDTLAELREMALSSAGKSSHWGVCVTGGPGCGKSALFAKTLMLLQNEDALVLAHAAGVGTRSRQVDNMLARWIQELAKHLGISNPLGDNPAPDDVDQAFRLLLSRVSLRRRVVVLIDALDQFEPTIRAERLTWLPTIWPENVRFIASAVPGTQSEALCKRDNVKVGALRPLVEEEARQVAQSVCRRYHRAMDAAALQVLINKRLADRGSAAGSPLWMTMAVEELNLLDADDFARVDREFSGTPENRLHQLVLDVAEKLPPDVESLYGWVLKRSGKIYGEAWANAFANAIAASRNGWREMDFQVLLPRLTGEQWDPLRFAGVRRSFRGQVRERGVLGQWDFLHTQARDSILRQNLSNPDLLQQLHMVIADHLESLSSEDPLRQTELMVHLIAADDRFRAARFCGGELTSGEMSGATSALAGHILAGKDQMPNAGLDWTCSLLKVDGLDDNVRAKLARLLVFELHKALDSRAPLSVVDRICRCAEDALCHLHERNQADLNLQRDLSISHMWTGDVLRIQGRLDEALASFEKGRAGLEELTNSHPLNADWWRDLSVILERIGDILLVQGRFDEALVAFEADLEIGVQLTAYDPTNGDWECAFSLSLDRVGQVQQARGQLGEALESFEKSRSICRRLVRSDPTNVDWQSNLAASLEKVGGVLEACGRPEEALEAFQERLKICQWLVHDDPANAKLQSFLAGAFDRLDHLLTEVARTGEAVAAARRSLEIRQQLARTDPTNTEWQFALTASLDRSGDLLKSENRLDEALAAFEESLSVRERLVRFGPSNTQWQYGLSISHTRVGGVLAAQGRLEEALTAYEAGREVAERLARVDPTNAQWQRNLSGAHRSMGWVLRGCGQLAVALASFEAGRAIQEALTRTDPSNAEDQHDLSVSHGEVGDVLVAQGRLGEALASYGAGREVAEHLTRSGPEDPRWQRQLYTHTTKIGEVLREQGRLEEAQNAFEASREAAERVTRADSANAEWQRSLMMSLIQTGAVKKARGKLEEALAAYEAAREIAEQATQTDPANAVFQGSLAMICDEAGDLLLAHERMEEALAFYEAGREVAEHLTRSDPTNLKLLHGLSEFCRKIGLALYAAGKHSARAYSACSRALDISTGLCETDPSNTVWLREMAHDYSCNAYAEKLRGDLSKAIAMQRKALSAFVELSTREPGNLEWQECLSLAKADLARMLSDTGDPEDALETREDSLAILDGLVAADPGNPHWGQWLSEVRREQADTELAMGNSEVALTAYRELHRYRDEQVAHAPDDAQGQDSLALLHAKVGEALGKQGRPRKALAAYRESEKILAKRFTSCRPTEDLVVNQSMNRERMGDLLVELGDFEQALGEYGLALDACRLFAAEQTPSPRLAARLYEIPWRVGYVNLLQGDFKEAIAQHKKSLTGVLDIAAERPDHFGHMQYRDVLFRKTAECHYAGGQYAEAVAALDECLEKPVMTDSYPMTIRLYALPLLWLAHAMQGDTQQANQCLSRHLDSELLRATDSWPLPVSRFLLGELSEEDLYRSSLTGDEEQDKERYCELLFYLGSVRLLDRDYGSALAHFQRCVDMKLFAHSQYALALAEHKKLVERAVDM